MSFKEKRIEYIRNWPDSSLFLVEKDYLDKYKSYGLKYSAYKFELSDDMNYNIVLSNVMDALDNLPQRPDIAFEFYWKAIDNLFKQLTTTGNNTSKEQLQFAIREVWLKQVNINNDLKALFKEITSEIKESSAKYLYKRLFESYNVGTIFEQQPHKNTRQLIIRLRDYHAGISKERVIKLIEYIGSEYGYPNETNYSQIHNGSRFLMRLLKGDNLILRNHILVNNNLMSSIQLNMEEQVNLIINGLLYTFRNDRFHGNLISPFRSSYTKFDTYSHPFYCLIWGELLLLLLLENMGLTNMNSIIEHCKNNLSFYKGFFL